MGSLYASLLCEAGFAVSLLDKSPERAGRLATRGLRLTGVTGPLRARPLVTADAAALPPAGLVVIAVKAYDTESAARAITPVLTASTVVLTLQNGLGNAEIIADCVGAERVVLGTTDHGAHLLDVGEVRHAGAGRTTIGWFSGPENDALRQLATLLTNAGLECSTTAELEPLLWRKLVVNAAINPLTALLRVRNGDLLAAPGRLALLGRVVDEALAVAGAAGIDLAGDAAPRPDTPQGSAWGSHMHHRVREVCQNTAANRSSMLQDVLKGRQTEIDAINGAILERAVSSGTAAPLNEMLVSLIRSL